MRAMVEDELRFSGGIVLSREEVVPRFRIEVPGEQGYLIFVPLPDDLKERTRRMRLVSGFMAWKGASGFVMSSELLDPDAIISVGVGHGDVLGAARMILRAPLTLGPLQWLARGQIGEELPALLPPRDASMSAEMMAELARVFGPQGEFRVERPQ